MNTESNAADGDHDMPGVLTAVLTPGVQLILDSSSLLNQGSGTLYKTYVSVQSSLTAAHKGQGDQIRYSSK